MEKGLTGNTASIVVLTALLILLLVQGFTGSESFPHSPLFTAVLLCLAVVLVLRVVENLRHFRLRRLPQALSHAAIALILFASILGRGDKQILSATVPEGQTIGMASDEEGRIHGLPFTLTLKDFTVEFHPSGMPSLFLSEVDITEPSGKVRSVDITVNHPASVGPWKIYQSDYDTEDPKWGTVSILECVRDPWYPAVQAGLWMLLVAGVGMVAFAGTKRKEERP